MENGELVKLCSVADKVQAEMIIDILKQNDILAYGEGIGAAGIMNIYAGNSTYGENIFVNKKDAEKAKGLTEGFLSGGCEPGAYNRSSKFSQTAAVIILILFALVMVYIFYISI